MSQRTRRTKTEQVRDMLLALLRQQEAEALADWRRYEVKRESVIATRTALEALGWEPPEKDTPVLADRSIQPPEPLPMTDNGTGDDLRSPPNNGIVVESAPTARPHRQRISEKADLCPICGHQRPWHLEICTELAAAKGDA